MPTRYIGDGYWEIASRQMSIVTRSEQERFKDAKITVIGCGGIGGETIEMLARMGIGELVLVDKDAFDLSNLNRQTMASIADLGLDKEAVAAEKVRLINPYVKVRDIMSMLIKAISTRSLEIPILSLTPLTMSLQESSCQEKQKKREYPTSMEPYTEPSAKSLYSCLTATRHTRKCSTFLHSARNWMMKQLPH